MCKKKSRENVVEWMIQMSDIEPQLTNRTLFFAVTYLDTYLSAVKTSPREINEVGIAAIVLARY